MSETHEGSSYASVNAVWKVSGANTRVRVWCKTSIREKHKLFLQKNIKYSFFLACCGATWFPSFSLFFRFQHQRSDVLTVSLMSGRESEKQWAISGVLIVQNQLELKPFPIFSIDMYLNITAVVRSIQNSYFHFSKGESHAYKQYFKSRNIVYLIYFSKLK